MSLITARLKVNSRPFPHPNLLLFMCFLSLRAAPPSIHLHKPGIWESSLSTSHAPHINQSPTLVKLHIPAMSLSPVHFSAPHGHNLVEAIIVCCPDFCLCLLACLLVVSLPIWSPQIPCRYLYFISAPCWSSDSSVGFLSHNTAIVPSVPLHDHFMGGTWEKWVGLS